MTSPTQPSSPSAASAPICSRPGDSSVRVRFAPSPTGYLHVGGARTALFNWLYARRMGGTFILRIEDTDVERSTREAEEGLLRDLRWLGLDWDEGPGVEGPHGPYRQSERQEVYRKAAQGLVDSGAAYRCFCSEELLEAKRQKAEAEHRSLHYDGTCRHLDQAEVTRRVAAGEPHVIRVRAPEKDYVLDDIVRGRVEWKAETLGDFIILRSSGMPVYNFCVVVDDTDMQITHVIRAEEHLPNTHRQLILYEAMGRPVPRFAHVSLILGPDKTKLSKRHGATAVGQYETDGFLPAAMVNFLALLGWNEGTDQEVYAPAELIEKFSLERICKSPAVFDQAKLRWMNGMHIRRLPLPILRDLILPGLLAHFAGDARLADDEFTLHLAAVLQNHLAVLPEAGPELEPILRGGDPENDEAREALTGEQVAGLLAALATELQGCAWNREAVNGVVKQAGKTVGAKGKNLFMPIRVALTGRCHGPDLGLVIVAIGRDEARRRLAGLSPT
jgi:glutamyl-tRNA synthetase